MPDHIPAAHPATAQYGTVINPGSTMALGKKRLKPNHLLVRQPKKIAHHSGSSQSLNQIAPIRSMSPDPKPAQFVYAKTTIKLLPAVKRLLRNPHSAQHLSHRRARLPLLQRVGDLLFGISTLLHGMLLQHKGNITGRLAFKPEKEIGGTSNWNCCKKVFLADWIGSKLQLVLITDSFPPLRNSGAVQLRDLSREFVRQGHSLTVLVPSAELHAPWLLEDMDGVRLLRLKAPRTKDTGYVRRTLAELAMPFAMHMRLRESPLASVRWDGVLWYAPSIFHGPLVQALKKSSSCKSYLIIRDIFPEWAADIGLMGRGLPYRFFSAVARYQYSVADTIGVQAPGNRQYFHQWLQQPGRRLEVLQNWLGKSAQVQCSIRVESTILAGRRVLVYAGNMGVAQGMDILLDLAEKMRHRTDVGFLLVGRGSDSARLKANILSRQLDNMILIDEIDPDEIPSLYAQCAAGIVALDSRHKSHNVPGKFLTYMQSGLPVLANINAGNDLAHLIRNEHVGQVCENNRLNELLFLTEQLLDDIENDARLTDRCTDLFKREFSVAKAVQQIVDALR